MASSLQIAAPRVRPTPEFVLAPTLAGALGVMMANPPEGYVSSVVALDTVEAMDRAGLSVYVAPAVGDERAS